MPIEAREQGKAIVKMVSAIAKFCSIAVLVFIVIGQLAAPHLVRLADRPYRRICFAWPRLLVVGDTAYGFRRPPEGAAGFDTPMARLI